MSRMRKGFRKLVTVGNRLLTPTISTGMEARLYLMRTIWPGYSPAPPIAGRGRDTGGRCMPRCLSPKFSCQEKARLVSPERAVPVLISSLSGGPLAVSRGCQLPRASKDSTTMPSSGNDEPKTVKSSMWTLPAGTETKELVLKVIAARNHCLLASADLSGISPFSSRHPSAPVSDGPANPPKDTFR